MMATETEKNPQGVRVLVMGSILQLFLGVIYVWSVFVRPVSVFYQWDIEKVKLTSSFMLSCFVLGILIGGKLLAKIGGPRVVLIGGLATAAGMLLASFVPAGAAWLIYITYGVIGGFGVGMAYNTINTCAQKWFPKKRGLAVGISVCMFGFSNVVFAPLIETLMRFNAETAAFDGFTPPTTFRLLAAAFALVTLLFFRFIILPPNTGAQAAASAALLEKRQYTMREMLQTKQFYLITLSMMLFTAAYFYIIPSLKTMPVDRGLSEQIGTVLVMITGIANALGRLATPVLADRIGSEKATLTIIILTVISSAVLSFAPGYLFLAAVAVIAFCYGGSSGVYPLVTTDYFGIKNVGSNYGAIMVGLATSALFFPMLLGLIHSTVISFIVLAALAAASAVLILLLMRSKKAMQETDATLQGK